MSVTCELISKQVLGTSSTTVTFSKIPQTYTDLYLVVSARSTTSAKAVAAQLTFNGSTTGYSERLLYGTGTSALTTTRTGSWFQWCVDAVGATATANTFGCGEVYIPNYTGAANKTVSSVTVDEDNATAGNIYVNAALWSNTAAITSISLQDGGGSFVAGSTFFLYGIRSANLASGVFMDASGGDQITISSGYKTHIFRSSGILQVSQPGWVEALIVGGGGGGGFNHGAGGGGGGVSLFSTYLPPGPTSVVVGAGGSGSSTETAQGSSGNQSSINSIFVDGGGGGGTSAGARNGLSGGSGGGASGGGGVPGTGVSGRGNNGGSGSPGDGTLRHGGGGGGAGAVGGAATDSQAGSGGSGASYSISGVSSQYGGGGGGGGYTGTNASGGSGGGGRGSSGTTGIAGLSGEANTGGGGGAGSAGSGLGASGGSGIVIIRYPA